MMKKVLSVALSVIMVLSLIAVPGFAADPAASVEYTVSNVAYAGQVYDELNPAADSDGYVMTEGINFVPDNGKKLVPSVNVSASEASTATVIFAVYTDGVLTNAFYETKAVGTDAVTFSKEITVADKEKETYKVFVLDANGNTVAPASSFPVALNALEYMEITYADGTSDKHFGEDLASDTIVANISDARKVANPSIQVVPADNTTVVSIDIGANFWNDGATIELKALDGEVITYNVISDLVKVGFTATLDNKFRFGGTALKKEAIVPTKQYASFEAGQEIVNVTVPYGAASITVDPIIIYENGVQKKSATEEVSMDGAAVKEYTIGVGSKEYKFVFAWDDSAPYVSEVKFNHAYPKRSIVVRADGASAVGYTSGASDISATTATVTTANTLANAGEANSLLTVNGTAIPNNSNLTVFAIAREDNFTRTDMINYDQPKWVHMTETEAWTSFKVSAAATVYVKMSHANAAEADFVWKEGVAAGWTKATSSNQGTIYYKTFAAGETVNVPSQTVTEAELAFVNAKLATAYPATATEVGSVQFQYQLADVGAQLYYKELTAAGWSEWTAHPKGKNDGATAVTLNGKKHRGMYYRNSADHQLSIGAYGSDTFIAVAFDNAPAGGEDPDQPGEGGGDEPVVPPTPATPKLSWTSALALTGAPKEQDNWASNTNLYAKGLYGLGNQSGEIELNPEETTVNLTVPYGVEAIQLNGGAKIDLLGDADHAVTTTVTVNEVEYTVNIAWAAYAYEAGLPMLYDLQYHVAGKENLAGGETWYYAVPSNLVLNADMDVVYGTGDLKGTNGVDLETVTVEYLQGTWFTSASQKKGNYAVVNGGASINRLRISPIGFRTFVDNGLIENTYAFNGATTIVTHYKDAVSSTVLAPRFTFKSAVKGYVIAAYYKEQTLGDDWTKLDGVKVETTNSSPTNVGTALQNPPTGHTNVTTSLGYWFNGYDHVFVKPVNVGDTVTINETVVTNDQPPFVLVVTEDMMDVDVEIPDAPTPDEPTPEDPTPDEPTPDVPATAKLRTIEISTAAHERYTEAIAWVTAGSSWAEDATEYVVKVPIGTGVITVNTANDFAENALAEAVTVDMAGKDEATAEILGCTVKFVWDDADPYITDVVVNAAFKGRWGVDSGADGDLAYTTTGANDSGALSSKAFSTLVNEGETAPALTKYVYSIATHTMNGQAHMADTTFGMRDTAYEGTTAENSLLSFKVSAPATVYAKAVALDGKWEELTAAGWTEAGTLSGAKLYKKDFAAGAYVYLPGTPTDDEEAEGYNANPATANIRYVKYVPSATVETTTGTKTLAEVYEGCNTSALIEGKWYQWSYDATEGKLVAPMTDSKTPPNPLTIDRSTNNGMYIAAFYVQFEAPATPVAPALASYTVTTTKSAIHQDVVAVTDEAGTFEGEEYTIVVPVGTATATATLTENTEAIGTATVDFAGLDAAETTVTVGENTYTVKFVWDDTNPYFYNTVFADKDASKQTKYGHDRHNIQYGSLASMLYDGGASGNVAGGKALYGETTEYTFVGVPAPDATADTVVLGIPSAVSGMPHMLRSNFFMLDKAFPANDASDAFASFQVGAAGTIYVKSPTNAGVWPEMDALVADENSGWYRATYVDGDVTKNANIKGFAVYAIDVEKGDTVAIPGAQLSDEYMAAYNASLAARGVSTRYYKFTSLDETIVTASGEMTWADACVAANVTDTSRLIAGVWYEWGWDADANLPTLPARYNNSAPVVRFATHGQLLVYGYFGDYEYIPEAPVDPNPEQPGEGGDPVDPNPGEGEDPTPEQPPVDPNPGEPEEPDNSANELVLSYTTALAVTSPKATNNHVNGKNRVNGAKSIYAGGVYLPTIVAEAASAVVDHEAKTAVVTVPYGTEIVNLVAATGAEAAIDLADNASIAMLNDNGAEKTFDVVAGESTYAVTVKWADAADANLGVASTGVDVYDIKYKMTDLWEGYNSTYRIVPTKLDLTFNYTVDASKYTEGEVPEMGNGVWYTPGELFYGNTTAVNIKNGEYADLARYKLGLMSFTPWVEAGIIADEADLHNATLVNTGEHYQVTKSAATGSNAEMSEYLSFRVKEDGVVYIAPSRKAYAVTDPTWAEYKNTYTLVASRGGSSGAYNYPIEYHSSILYVKNVTAGELVTIPVNLSAGDYTPIVIYDAGATYVVPSVELKEVTYKIGDGEATAVDFSESTMVDVELPWDMDEDISVTATIDGKGSLEVGGPINRSDALNNIGIIYIKVTPLLGDPIRYAVRFIWGEKPADPEEPGEGGDPVDPNPGEGEDPVDPEQPTPVSLGDIEDAGVAADTDASLGATQDAASADVTIEGNAGAEARGQHVVVFVLADGKTLADVTTALSGSGDLVAEGIVLGMGSATVDANGDYAVDMTLPGSVTSGSYDVAVITGEEAENVEDALVFVAISEKVAAYNAIVTGAADPFAGVELIISAGDIYAALSPSGKAAVEASVLAKDAVDALPEITEPTPGEFVGLENIATLGAIIDTRIAAEALNDGADAAELDLLWYYLFPAADVESDDIVAVAGAIYKDATALNATGKAKVVAAIAEQDYETKTVGGAQVSVKTQVQADFAEAAFVELINNTGYSNINSVAALVDTYIEAGVFEDLTGVSTTTLSTIVRDHTISSYATFEALVESLTGGSDTPTTGGTEVVVPGTNAGTTTGGMSSSNKPAVDPNPVVPTPAKKQLADFTDAGDAAWAATALQMMLDREIMNGYEDETIRPNNNATRQEVAKMLVEAFSEVRAGAWTGFADVPAGSWYYSYVATAAEDGIIKGVSATDFGTDAMITREDLSVLIYRFLVNKGITLDTNANKVFTDATSISDYAADAINALSNAGVINGYEDGSFNPKGNATRAEIAQVIANVLVLFAL